MAPEAETLERAALEDLHLAATDQEIRKLGLEALTIDGALVSIAARLLPSAIVINRAIGFGLDRPATAQTVRDIAAAYREADVARYFVHVHPDAKPEKLPRWLERAGLEKARGWQKFARGNGPVEVRETGLSVREIGPEHGEAFGRIVCAAFDLGDDAIPWLARLPGRERWHVFMSFDGEDPAGAGALFVDGHLAWTDFGATSPGFRRRGSQSAVLAARIKRAVESGCRRMFTCTGVDVPGDPQHSYRNILRAGFRQDYVRENYAPPER